MSDRHDDDEARKAILTRRAKFVTIALAGAGIAISQGCDTKPLVCLEVEVVPPPSAAPTPCLSEVAPGPCLEAPMPDSDDQRDAGADAGARDAGALDAGAPKPKVCLRVAPPKPQPCLSPPRPKNDRGDDFGRL